MSIFIKGVKVRAEEVEKNQEVTFSELTKLGQERLFLEHKELFLLDALKSQYEDVINLAKKFKNEYSSDHINKAIRMFIKSGAYEPEFILEFLEVPNFEIEESLLKMLAKSEYWKLRVWVAQYPKTSFEILKNMFLGEARHMVKSDVSIVFDEIIKNQNFEIDEEIKQLINLFSDKYEKDKIVKRIEKLK